MDKPFFKESINTIKADSWTIFLAKLFGKKTTGSDGSFTVTIYTWRGISYLVDFREN